MADANTGYVTINGSNKPVYKTTDGGENWLPLTTGLTGIINEVKAVDANNIYIVTSSGTSRVAKSTNGGALDCYCGSRYCRLQVLILRC
jgi:photosystem II stability/assembly factor-like uncharacterized protein